MHFKSILLFIYTVGSSTLQTTKTSKPFLIQCPDRWGRLLMQRREAVIARRESRKAKSLLETDYLLGVHDSFRMGALRFRIDRNGNFLDDNQELAAPAITSLPELEQAANGIENKL